MFQKMTRTNEKGFTLIELMIVIAIIGILAAIAIPNFISYRNKSYCSGAESDANTVAAMIANWAAIPTHTSLPTIGDLGLSTMTNGNVPAIAGASGTNGTITITVTDNSGRCPSDYKAALPSTTNPLGYWNGNVYTKVMTP